MRTWYNEDKSEWGVGNWVNEPDKVQWVDGDSGLDCLIVRAESGALCGYVGVPESHEHYGKDYLDVLVDVHGGLTYSKTCSPNEDESKGICHTGHCAANKTVWWLGFDCNHASDLAPKPTKYSYKCKDDNYRNLGYVHNQVTQLANQLK